MVRPDLGGDESQYVDEQECSFNDAGYKIQYAETYNNMMGMRLTFQHSVDIYTYPNIQCDLG